MKKSNLNIKKQDIDLINLYHKGKKTTPSNQIEVERRETKIVNEDPPAG